VQSKTDDELLSMVYEFDQWSPEMLLTVESELSRRNILPADINTRRQELVAEEEKELLQGKEASAAGLIIGWLTVLGLWGLYAGYNYSHSKIRSKYTGKLYYEYDEDSRNKGAILFYTAIAALVLSIMYLIVKLNSTSL
jgi:hypothetical protein